MTQQQIPRQCLSLLDSISAAVDRAVAFGPEVRMLHESLKELQPLLSEFQNIRDGTQQYSDPLLGIQAALQSFLEIVHRCSTQGPLQTLLTAEDMNHQLVNAVLRVQRELGPLQRGQLPTVVTAQAKLLSPQLGASSISFQTLRRLRSVYFELQEEAERVRLGLSDASAFSDLLARLTLGCPAALLASDATFLEQQAAAAQASHRLVQAHLFHLTSTIIRDAAAAATSAATAVGSSSRAVEPSSNNGGGSSSNSREPQASSGTTTNTPKRTYQQQPAAVSSPRTGVTDATLADQRPSSSSSPTGGGSPGVLAHLNSPSMSQNDRAAALEALRHSLQGPERAQTAQALAEAG
ncbi:hypothetical protein Agub_g9988, partial [Astrephomene gubernaculifera]